MILVASYCWSLFVESMSVFLITPMALGLLGLGIRVFLLLDPLNYQANRIGSTWTWNQSFLLLDPLNYQANRIGSTRTWNQSFPSPRPTELPG